MTVYVLDSSALLRYLDDESGADRVEAVLKDCVSGRARILISAMQWGEIAGNLRKRVGAEDELRILGGLLPSEVEIVPITGTRAVHAADLRFDRKIAYADAFALELTMEAPDHVLLTVDYGFKVVDDLAHVEFLPTK
jgi:predicted nucleic acid-binding protein